MSNLRLGSLWRKSIGPDVPAPDWVNVPDVRRSQLMTTYAKVVIEGDQLKVIFNARLSQWVNLGLTLPGSLLITLIAFKASTSFGLFMVILSFVTMVISFWMTIHFQKSADYLMIDRSTQIIELPQQGVRIPIQTVDRFQCAWRIHPRRSVFPELFLLARDNSGTLLRYPVMYAPSRRKMEQLVEFSGIPMEERHKRPWGLFGIFQTLERRETDINTP